MDLDLDHDLARRDVDRIDEGLDPLHVLVRPDG
jgi:hypothetical protein